VVQVQVHSKPENMQQVSMAAGVGLFEYFESLFVNEDLFVPNSSLTYLCESCQKIDH